AVKRSEPRPDVGEPDARAGGAGESLAVIRDAERECPAAGLRLYENRAAFGERSDAVLDRVLDEGREHHRRHARGAQRRRSLARAPEPRPQADPRYAGVCRAE